jgi:S1-C subfamily serine protease
MKIQIIKYCLTFILLLGHAGEIFAQGEWFQTEKPNCLVWNPNPNVGETVTWSGDCLNGKAHGIGIEIWRFKTSGKWVERPIVGNMLNGRFSGDVKIFLENGDQYFGMLSIRGGYIGQGTYTYAHGDKYVGEWKGFNRNGQGTYTHSDGSVLEGIWKDGKFQYAKTPTKPVPVVKTPIKPVPVVKTPTQDDQVIPASSGSGFAVSSDGYVITNSHVINGCQDVVIHTPQKDIKMRVISNDPKNDLALLKGNFKPSAVFSLSTERPEILQDIYVAGYPFGYKVSSSVKVTKGIISSLTGIGNDFSNMQIDAALQSGNSGGPILDDMGNVVGVAVAKLDAMQMLKETGSIPENTNFGIKASVVKSVLDSSSVDTPSANTSAISKSQLGKMITDGTYYISCWMTLAQIEKVRSKKVLFSELD